MCEHPSRWNLKDRPTVPHLPTDTLWWDGWSADERWRSMERSTGTPHEAIPAVRSGPLLEPDVRRVLARPFVPGEWHTVGRPRIAVVVDRVLAVPDDEADAALAQVVDGFGDRHRDLDAVLVRHAWMVAGTHGVLDDMSPVRLRLLGAYLTQEYAVEAAALTNPSMVPAPGAGVDGDGVLPVVLSARAIGEGHVSSIVFREGLVRADGTVTVHPAGRHVEPARRTEPDYDRRMFSRQIVGEGADPVLVDRMLGELPAHFSMEQLEGWLRAFTAQRSVDTATHEVVRLAHLLASANYVATFPDGSSLDARVLFPVGPTESRGMEDARFVRFVDDDGSVRYHATYTAYDGFTVRPQLIETADFRMFKVATIGGRADPGKGLALFPRRIGGRFAALTRPDHESIAVAFSDHRRFWSDEPVIVWRPGGATWDLIQLGNNGSPIETDAGWLVLTHGVGPMRRYVFGALLLDREDPTRPLGYLPDALLAPQEAERDGYVPNVVYSCGGLVHAGVLVVPYGFSDRGTAVATFPLDEVLDRLVAAGNAGLDAA